MSAREIEIWPNPLLFEFGVLKSHSKFTFQNLRRIINYSVEKGSNGGGYPLLSWKRDFSILQ